MPSISKKHCIWRTTKKKIAADNNPVVYILEFFLLKELIKTDFEFLKTYHLYVHKKENVSEINRLRHVS